MDVRLWGAPKSAFHYDREIIATPNEKLALVSFFNGDKDPVAVSGSKIAIYSELIPGTFIFRGMLMPEHIESAYKEAMKRTEASQRGRRRK